jgi:hypothetical protein
MEIENMEEKKFEKLINDLNNLRKVEAPDNFEFKLQTKLQNLSDEEYLPTKRPNKLIPAFALASIVVLLFIIYRPFADEYEDPFQIQPQVREDIIAFSETEGQAPLSDLLNDSFKENDSNIQKKLTEQSNRNQKDLQDLNKNLSAAQQYQLSISKEDLNFTRPVMSDEEIKQVQVLKQKLMSKRN